MKRTVDIDDLYEMFPECMVDELLEQMKEFAINVKEAVITVVAAYRDEFERLQSSFDEMRENATEEKEEIDFIDEDESSFDKAIIENIPGVNLVEKVVDGFIFKEWKPP